ncbi:MAG: hypothetical protein GW859_09000 [Sphingomonadales bacterium]|nr:hypothetical protein [Sphingomonadales bacterium]
MKVCLWVGTFAIAVLVSVPASGQDKGDQANPAPAVKTPAPPAPPAPPAIPRILAATGGVKMMPAATHDPAPGLSSQAWPTGDKKAAKALTKKQIALSQTCFNGGLKSAWLAKDTLRACDALLAMPVAPTIRADNRAVVLQRRALALIALDDPAMALDAVTQSETIGRTQGNPLFADSTGIGNGLIKAYILGQYGRTPEALDLLTELRARRPYSTSIMGPIDRMEAFLADDIERLMDARIKRAPIDPNSLRSLIPLYVLRGELDQAAAIGDQVSLIDPPLHGSWSLIDGPSQGEQQSQRAAFQMMHAYALAATGEAARAEQIIADVRADIVAFLGTSPFEKSRVPSPTKLREYSERKRGAEAANKIVDDWATGIALRTEAQMLSREEFLAAHQKELPEDPLLGIDLMRTLAAHQGEVSADIKDALERSQNGIGHMLIDIDRAKLFDMIPDAESPPLVPKFASSASKWLFNDGSGYSQDKEDNGNIRTVRYETMMGTIPIVEEMMLLAVANYARSEGKDSFVILSNRSMKRVYVNGFGGTTGAAGFEAQVRVRLLNRTNLPDDLQPSEARIITVDEIWTELKPRYDRIDGDKSPD